MANAPGTDVATPANPRPDDVILRDINSVDDAFRALADMGVDVRDISDEIGTGFSLLDDAGKASLVRQPFVIVAWTFSIGEYGEFVTAFLVTEDQRKLILNDGSTGIREQLSAYTADTGRQNGLLVRHGLRRSDYRISRETHEPVGRDYDGETDPATTFYLDTSR